MTSWTDEAPWDHDPETFGHVVMIDRGDPYDPDWVISTNSSFTLVFDHERTYAMLRDRGDPFPTRHTERCYRVCKAWADGE